MVDNSYRVQRHRLSVKATGVRTRLMQDGKVVDESMSQMQGKGISHYAPLRQQQQRGPQQHIENSRKLFLG